MIRLYDHPLSGNCYKVRLALNQLGVEYEKVTVDIFKGEQNSPEFVALNPNRKIPVLVDNGFVIWESNAILLYLGKRFFPNRIYSDALDPALARARFMTRFVPEEARDPKELEALRESGRTALRVLNEYLKENEFLAGSYSIADIGCFAYVSTAEEGGVSLSDFPAVKRWCERVCSQPGYIPIY